MPHTVRTLDTGLFRLDGGAMFGVVPKPLWARRIAADDRNRIPLAMRCLLVEAGDRLVLVDAGLGHKYDARFADLYAIDHETATLERSLAAAGFHASDVTDVVLTHLHFDHIGGVTARDGDGRVGLVFPGARHHVQRRHWEAAQAPNPRERASFFADNLDPLADAGVLVLHDGPGEILDGIATRVVDGHTDAQQVVLVETDGGTVAFCADLVPTRHHLPPAWTMGYDVRPLVSMDERAAFLRDAIAGDWTLVFEHDAEVEAASVVMGEKGPEVRDPRPLRA